MWKLLLITALHCSLQTVGLIYLKFGLAQMKPFGMNWQFWGSLLQNWQLAFCGLCFGLSTLIWMYLMKHYPMSIVTPLGSMGYVFAIIAAIFVFHEEVTLTKWASVAFIVCGCFLITK